MKKFKKILIVEDDKPSELFISLVVENFTNKILTAKTGIEAVEICQENCDIELILMDIIIPEMNGYEATRQIRKFNQNVIIIAQTAFVIDGGKEKSFASGCNDYVLKPINRSNLEQIIRKYLKKLNSSQSDKKNNCKKH